MSLKEQASYGGIAVIVFATVVGAGVAKSRIDGLIQERDHWRSAALAPKPTPTVSSPTSLTPTGPAAAPSPASRATRPPAPPASPTPSVIQVAARSGHAPAGGGGAAAPPTPAAPPRASSPKTPSPATCPPAAVATVRAPVGVLPCNTAVVGGAG